MRMCGNTLLRLILEWGIEMEKKTLYQVGGIAAGVVILYCALQNITKITGLFGTVLSIFSPVLFGFVIAFVLNIPMTFLESKWTMLAEKYAKACATNKKKKHVRKQTGSFGNQLKRPICMLLSMAFIVGILTLVLRLVIPELGKTLALLMRDIPEFIKDVIAWAEAHADDLPLLAEQISELKIDWEKTGKEFLSTLGTGAVGLVNFTVTTLSVTFGALIDFIVAFIFSIYVLLNKEKLAAQFHKLLVAYLPKKPREICLHVSHTAYYVFTRFITGQCTEAVILGSLCAAGMILFRFPYAAMVGALVGVTALIPVVGAFLGAGVGAFMIFMQDPLQALLFVVYLTVLQQLEGNIIYPRVVGQSVGLPAMWVMAAVAVGGGIGGIGGMLLAVPVASIAYTLLRENVNKKIAQK